MVKNEKALTFHIFDISWDIKFIWKLLLSNGWNYVCDLQISFLNWKLGKSQIKFFKRLYNSFIWIGLPNHFDFNLLLNLATYNIEVFRKENVPCSVRNKIFDFEKNTLGKSQIKFFKRLYNSLIWIGIPVHFDFNLVLIQATILRFAKKGIYLAA